MKINILVFSMVTVLLSQAQDLKWIKQMGGTSGDIGKAIAVDAYGNVFTTGSFQGTCDFDPSSGVFNLTTSTGSADAFISKLDGFGNFVWAKKFDGPDVNVSGSAIAADKLGNLYVLGNFRGTVDFDPGANTHNLSSVSTTHSDVFITKLDGSGNFIWAKSMGGNGQESGLSLVISNSGFIFSTGIYYGSADFDPGSGTYILNAVGDADVFVSKLDSTGNFVWAKGFGGKGYEGGTSMSLDEVGNIYITGSFFDTVDFDTGPGLFSLSSLGGGSNIFITKLDHLGAFTWAKSIGADGPVGESGNAIAVNGYGIYITGYFAGTVDFDPAGGVANLSAPGSFGNADIFVLKLGLDGKFQWARNMGGKLSDKGSSIAVDSRGSVLVTGTFTDTADFDPGSTVNNFASAGFTDVFVSMFDSIGNMKWTKCMGGYDPDLVFSVTIDKFSNILTTGSFSGASDFDPDAGITILSSVGEQDIFIHKMSQSLTSVDYTPFVDFILYPNPSNGVFMLQIRGEQQEMHLAIYNSLGLCIQEYRWKSGVYKIDLSAWPNGLYILKLRGINTAISTSVVIKN